MECVDWGVNGTLGMPPYHINLFSFGLGPLGTQQAPLNPDTAPHPLQLPEIHITLHYMEYGLNSGGRTSALVYNWEFHDIISIMNPTVGMLTNAR